MILTGTLVGNVQTVSMKTDLACGERCRIIPSPSEEYAHSSGLVLTDVMSAITVCNQLQLSQVSIWLNWFIMSGGDCCAGDQNRAVFHAGGAFAGENGLAGCQL